MKSLQEIEQVVCEVFGVSSDFIHKKSRADRRPIYRYLICYSFRKINKEALSFEKIGSYFGYDHSTMINGMMVIEDELYCNTEFCIKTKEVFKRLDTKNSAKEDTRKKLLQKIGVLFLNDRISSYDFNVMCDLIDAICYVGD